MILTNKFLEQAKKEIGYLKRIQAIHLYKDGWIYYKLTMWVRKRMSSGDKYLLAPSEVADYLLSRFKTGDL